MKTTKEQRARLKRKSEQLRRRMLEHGIDKLPDDVITQNLNDCFTSADGRFVTLPPCPYFEDVLIFFEDEDEDEM